MEGKGTPKNEQNQFCHSPSVKAMTPSEVERQDSHAAGVKCSLRDLSPSLMQAVKMECRGRRSVRAEKVGVNLRQFLRNSGPEPGVRSCDQAE